LKHKNKRDQELIIIKYIMQKNYFIGPEQGQTWAPAHLNYYFFSFGECRFVGLANFF